MQNNTKKTLFKVLGILLLISGVSLAVFGFIDFFKALANIESPKYFPCTFVGILLIGIGGIITILSFRREVHVTVTKQILENSIVKSTEVFNTVISDELNVQTGKICTKCGVKNDSDSRFCKHCGESIV